MRHACSRSLSAPTQSNGSSEDFHFLSFEIDRPRAGRYQRTKRVTGYSDVILAAAPLGQVNEVEASRLEGGRGEYGCDLFLSKIASEAVSNQQNGGARLEIDREEIGLHLRGHADCAGNYGLHAAEVAVCASRW